ncbi:hypothetical protein WA016_02008 [Myxococcus stipitatus]
MSINDLTDKPRFGLGLETTLNWLDDVHGLGGFAQAQWMTQGHARLAGGVQGTLVFGGLELGVYHSTGTQAHLPTTGLQLTPFVTGIYGSLGVRIGIPLSDKGGGLGPGGVPGRVRQGHEVGLALTGKAPLRAERPWHLRAVLSLEPSHAARTTCFSAEHWSRSQSSTQAMSSESTPLVSAGSPKSSRFPPAAFLSPTAVPIVFSIRLWLGLPPPDAST